jgi:hypothetical protein
MLMARWMLMKLRLSKLGITAIRYTEYDD